MPGHLALIGLSDRDTEVAIDRYLLEKSGGRKIVYLPTASVEWEQASIDETVAYVTAFAATALGAEAIVPPVYSREAAHDPANVEAIRDANYIFIGGGRPGPLCAILRDTPVWSAIVERWEQGAVLAGESAGALALMDEVPTISEPGGPFSWEPGLGLLPGMRAVAHLDTDKGQWILAGVLAAAPENALVVGIPERSAVVRDPDGHWTRIGADGVIVMRNGAPTTLDALDAITPALLTTGAP